MTLVGRYWWKQLFSQVAVEAVVGFVVSQTVTFHQLRIESTTLHVSIQVRAAVTTGPVDKLRTTGRRGKMGPRV